MLKELEGYDWKMVFQGGSDHTTWNYVAPDGSLSLDEQGVAPHDVATVLYMHRDTWDGWSGWVLAQLTDGRFIFASGWCDYTGWGCQDGAQQFVGDTKETLLQYAMSPEERTRIQKADQFTRGI